MQNKRGAAAILAVIIITALVVLITLSYAFIAMTNLEIGFASQRSGDVVLSAETCVEEGILRISRDNSYTGSSLTVGDVTCTIVVTGTPCGDCTIAAEASAAGFTRNIEADVSVSGATVDITSWEEID